MNKNFITTAIVSASLLTAKTAFAVCPVCVVAVGAGVGISRWLGIDDTITGSWIGGLTLAVSIWTINWLSKKNFNFPAKKLLTFVAYYLMVFASLKWTDLIGHPDNKVFGIDKIIFGIVLGSIVFIIGNALYAYTKKKNSGKALFPFQKVAMPVGCLIILSICLYFFI